jgi:archaellum component FlaF (FlaF/FlaG flagellin family)
VLGHLEDDIAFRVQSNQSFGKERRVSAAAAAAVLLFVDLISAEKRYLCFLNSKQQTANSKQQTANSKQQTANSKQQTANSKQQTANSKHQ